MRIDPEAVYLEIQTHALIWNFTESTERHGPAVTLHFKDGNKWQRRDFFGKDGDTLESLLSKLGAWVDQHGLQGAIDQAMGRDDSRSAVKEPSGA